MLWLRRCGTASAWRIACRRWVLEEQKWRTRAVDCALRCEHITTVQRCVHENSRLQHVSGATSESWPVRVALVQTLRVTGKVSAASAVDFDWPKLRCTVMVLAGVLGLTANKVWWLAERARFLYERYTTIAGGLVLPTSPWRVFDDAEQARSARSGLGRRRASRGRRWCPRLRELHRASEKRANELESLT